MTLLVGIFFYLSILTHERGAHVLLQITISRQTHQTSVLSIHIHYASIQGYIILDLEPQL